MKQRDRGNNPTKRYYSTGNYRETIEDKRAVIKRDVHGKKKEKNGFKGRMSAISLGGCLWFPGILLASL